MVKEITLAGYQQKAVDAILSDVNHFLGNKQAEITLKSPTGSGKTVMATALLEAICEENDNVAFLWTTVGKGELHVQGGESIQEKTTELTVKYLDNVFLGTPMDHKDVFVVNWEKLNSKDNVLVREGESHNFFDLLNVTRDNGTKLILVVDESHLGASQNSNTAKIKNAIRADIIINLSATPTADQRTGHAVSYDEVIEAGVIKSSIALNRHVDAGDENGEISALLNAAIEKRDYLKSLYPNNINPLVLITVPNAKAGEEIRERVESMLTTEGVTYGNGKLAVWMSGKDKKNLDNITAKDSEVEYLIFKTAIATGWDCTRAHILVKLRSTKSEKFSRQLTGRILRMPERKHYESDALNTAFIYTNEISPKFEEDVYPTSRIKTKNTKLRPGVDIKLELNRLKRIEKAQIYRDTYKPFLHAELDNHVFDTDYTNFEVELLKDTTINISDNEIESLETVKVKAGNISVSDKVLAEIRVTCKEEGITYTDSFKTVMILIMNYISMKNKFDTVDGRILGLIMLQNMGAVKDAIQGSMQHYFAAIEEKLASREYNTSEWSPPKELRFYDEDKPTGRWFKYAYGKFYHKMNELELDYAEALDDDVSVLFWLKNGDSGKDHFSIPYGDGRNFYPDFIIKYIDGSIKIGETKGTPFHVQAKRVALEEYCKKHGFRCDYILDAVEMDKLN